MMTIEDVMTEIDHCAQRGASSQIKRKVQQMIRELCGQWYETGVSTGRRQALYDVTQRLATIPDMGDRQ